MGAAAVPVAVAAGGLQAASSIMSGREAARAAAFEQQQLGRRRTENEIAGAQDEARRRADLAGSLQTFQALMAGSGLSTASPSSRAIAAATVRDTEADIATSRYNALAEGDNLRMAQQEAGRRKRSAMLQGYLGAAGAAANAGMLLYSMGAFNGAAQGGNYAQNSTSAYVKGSTGKLAGGV